MLGLVVDSEKRAKAFITEALKTRVVYFLEMENGSAESTESNEFFDDDDDPVRVIPFWSKSYLPYARKYSDNCPMHKLTLEDFVNLWLPGMNNDGVVVGLNWDQNGIGSEWLPTDLLDKLAP